MIDKIGIVLVRLRNLIDNTTVSRKVIADKIGCDVSTVTKHYNGDRNLTIDYVIKYAKYFNVSADYLLGLSEAKTSDKDLQYVCNFTGLSEESVLQFNHHKELISKSANTHTKSLFTLIYDYFISSDKLFELAHIISSYVDSRMTLTSNNNKYHELIKTLELFSEDVDEENNIPQEFLDNYVNQMNNISENEPNLEKECKIALFEAQELIMDFAKNFYEKKVV